MSIKHWLIGLTSAVVFLGCSAPVKPITTDTPVAALVSSAVVPTPTDDLGLSSISTPTMISPSTPVATDIRDDGIPAPPGMVLSNSENVWLINSQGKMKPLIEISKSVSLRQVGVQSCSEGAKILLGLYDYELGETTYVVIDEISGETKELNPGVDQTFCRAVWWPGGCDTVFAIVQPFVPVGRYCEGIPGSIDLQTGVLSIIGEEPSRYGSLSAPSPDGQAIAFTQYALPWLYWRGVGSRSLDPAQFEISMENMSFLRPAWSPDGSQIAWLVSGEVEGEWTEGVGIFDLDKDSFRFYSPYLFWAGEFPGYLDWNPQGDLLMVESAEEGLSVLSTNGDMQYTIPSAWDAQWSPDGTWLSYALAKGNEISVNIRSADGSEIIDVGPGRPEAWSPDSDSFIYSNSGLWIIEVGAWEPVRLDLPEDTMVESWILIE